MKRFIFHFILLNRFLNYRYTFFKSIELKLILSQTVEKSYNQPLSIVLSDTLTSYDIIQNKK